MSDRPEYIKCARVVEAEDPTADFVQGMNQMYEVKWVGSEDDPSENTWEREGAFSGSHIVEDFWSSQPKPVSEPNEDGEFNLGSIFQASQGYIDKRIRYAAAAQLPKSPARPSRTSLPTTLSNKRLRSTSLSGDERTPTSRIRHGSPLANDEAPPLPRPMVRPVVGSVLTFKKGGKAFVQDRKMQVQDYRAFRHRGGIYWQQHLRKDRERRLEEARKRAEEAAEAAAEEARRVAEALHEAEEAERVAEEERLAEETAQIAAEANERARKAAEWSAPRPEPPRKSSPPPLKELLASHLDDDDLPDFEEDQTEHTPVPGPMQLSPSTIFGSSNSLLSGGDSKSTKKKSDPYYWAKKLDDERRRKELMSRHPRFKLLTQPHGTFIEVFMKDITNEPSRSPQTPAVSIFANTMIDGVTTQDDVESVIIGVESGWSPARSVARLAPVDPVHWAALEVLALELLVGAKVVIGDRNMDGWRPIIFASEEEGIFDMLGAPELLANYQSTLLFTMVKSMH